MRQILPPVSAVQNICGVQPYRPERSYRPTAYCVTTSCPEGTLLYHTLTGELLLLEGQERPEEHVAALAAARFCVPAEQDEAKYLADVRRIAALLQPAGAVTSFTILTTTACNARCAYCYESGFTPLTMSAATAAETAAYIARVSGGAKVRLRWFGGEPLCNRAAITAICRELTDRSISFTSQMTSNGFLLDAQTLGEAVSLWKLQQVQITLDGTEERYNRIKSYVQGGASPYRRVMEHIDMALRSGVHVRLRLNMDRNNADDLAQLLEELGARFAGREGLGVYPALLNNTTGCVAEFASEEQALERLEALRRRAAALGFARVRPLRRELRLQQCMADHDGSVVVLPDGRLLRCEHIDEGQVYGSIRDGVTDPARLAAWKETVRQSECDGCALDPLCRRLKNCPFSRTACTAQAREAWKEELRRQIRQAYLTWRETGKGEVRP
ncbi:MAG: radical SAM protein [Oscillospiraceae bacterium]|nr:radical SAM protein [Oscillospiraceae bacterium]